jgi:HEAT repeat protein
MTTRDLILIIAGIMLAVGILTVLAWFIYTAYLDRLERRLAARKGLYRELVSGLAGRDRALLDSTVHQMSTLYDLDALEAVLEEQARMADGRPGWLLEVYDRLGLVDKYIEKLRSARKWRDRAFAAELLGRVGGAKAVPVLLETVRATRTEDSDVREIALRALARIADPAAVEPLIQALTTADAWLAPRIADILTRHGEAAVDPLIAVLGDSARQPARAWAANVLGEVRAQRAFPTLVRVLNDTDDEVRAKAATALGRLGDRRAVGYLLERLITDTAPFVRLRIASSLGQFGSPEVTDWLVRALGDSAWWVRMRSIEALEQIGAAAEGPLLVALDDSDSEIRGRAAAALERIGVPDNLIRMIESGEQLAEATEMLEKFARAGSRELLADLVQHPSSEVRARVLSVLQRSGRSDVVPEIARIASGDEEPAIRALAFDTLRSLRAPDALPAALDSLADPDQRVRAAATALLGELGGPEVVALLRARTVDPDAVVRAAAAQALGTMRAADAEPDFGRLLEDPKPVVREAAVWAAAATGLNSLLPSMVELLADSEPSVRRHATDAIVQLGDRSVTPVLTQAYSRATPEIRETIAITLSRLDPAALSGLMDILDDALSLEGKLALIRTLAPPRTAEALTLLHQLSADVEPGVRAAAVKMLGRARVAVASGLRDPDETVRVNAVDSCCKADGETHARAILGVLHSDPSPRVRERAALAIGLLGLPIGEEALLTASRRSEPVNVRAAAVLGAAVLDRGSLVARVLEMPDQLALRELLRERLEHDARYRLLAGRLSAANRLELSALAAESADDAQATLAQGVRGIMDAGERARLIGSLQAFQGEQSRQALLEIVRTDPSPEVRTAALSAVGNLLDSGELITTGTRALGDPSVLVRRAAVALFALVPPARAMAKLMAALRVDDDPAVLSEVAGLAEEHFPVYAEVVQGLPPDSDRAVLAIRIARHIHHPELHRVFAPLATAGTPEVRAAVADLWQHRPDAADPAALEALSHDPVISVRQAAAWAALASNRYDILDRMVEDPTPAVRREVAIVLGREAPVERPGIQVLERLAADGDMGVRAAAHVARLLQGTPLAPPPGIDGQVSAQAVRDIADLPSLRQIARGDREEDRRLAAALTLALLQDEVAREVARTDPAPAVRHRVGGALELSLVPAGGSGA